MKMRSLLCGASIFLICFLPASALAGHLTAVAGDTLRMHDGQLIRIIGLDAPEIKSAKCDAERRLGIVARQVLQVKIDRGRIKVVRTERRLDKYGRNLAYVIIDGENIATWMIGQQLARPYDGKSQRKGWCELVEKKQQKQQKPKTRKPPRVLMRWYREAAG